MGLILDTSAYSAYGRGNVSVKSLIEEADTMYFPAIVIGELLYGFRKGTQFVSNNRTLQSILKLDRSTVVAVDVKTADIYGELKEQLRSLGISAGANDLWIAAICIQLQLPLLTLDSDFERIPGLELATF